MAPNLVVPEIRVISALSAVISWAAAARAAGSLAPELAAWTDRSRMRLSMVWTSLSAPSAVWRTEMPSWALRLAWRRPLVWARRFWLMTRPAASSAARLMRKPEESFSRFFPS
ncbi:unannotated protein [freshwater metagenome]|uniref:Unannotated protein n=1 Tax=freshwater metagenome TaxID=449393 RepID=A0A6J6H4M4_9ZZZZ